MKRFNGAVVLETDHGTNVPTRRVSLMCLDEVCDRVATVRSDRYFFPKKGGFDQKKKQVWLLVSHRTETPTYMFFHLDCH